MASKAPSQPAGRQAPSQRIESGRNVPRTILVLVLSAVLYQVSSLVPHAHKLLSSPYLPEFSSELASHASQSGGINGSDSCFNLLGYNSEHETYMNFCEDVEILHADFEGHSLFSCDINRGRWNTVMGPLNDPKGNGSIWIWDHQRVAQYDRREFDTWKKGQPRPQLVPLADYPQGRDFHPLGTQFDPQTNRLFVVNHAIEASAIEIFQLERDQSHKVTARHLLTINDPLATHTPNSIVVLPGGKQLLVSQDHFVSKRSPGLEQLTQTYQSLFGNRHLATFWARILNIPFIAYELSRFEILLGLRTGWVTLVAWDFPQESSSKQATVTYSSVLIDQIPFANGLALGASGKTLAVASTTSHSVRLYNLQTDEKAMTVKESAIVPLDFLPDNLSLIPRPNTPSTPEEEDPLHGDLLIVTGHPQALKLLSIAKNPYQFFSMAAKAYTDSEKTESNFSTKTHAWANQIAPSRSLLISWRTSSSSPPTSILQQISKSWTYEEIYSGRGNLQIPTSTSTSSKLLPESQVVRSDQSQYWTFPDLHGEKGRQLGLDTSSAAFVDYKNGLSVVVGLYASEVLVCKI
ncbi:unnamed protein product [Sympodiomycopsis kandeliae]